MSLTAAALSAGCARLPVAPPVFLQGTGASHITERLTKLIKEPVVIDKINLLRTQGKLFVRVHAANGIVGTTLCNERMEHLHSLLNGLVIPFYIGKDARQVETLCEEVFLDERNYKYGGMPFWNCAGTVEIAVWDLLGRIADLPVAQLLGQPIRSEVPVYLSSLTRNTTPEQETANLQQKIERSGARAVKIKVGGRMHNTPEAEARTQALVPLLRKTLGNDITIYADANGSYTPKEGIRIARLLEDYGVDVLEEPCPWEDYNGNRLVNRSLRRMKLAGGEQDTSFYRFQDMVETGVYSILQPDLYYNGGIVRALKVARLAEQHGKHFAPHSPKADPMHAPFLQLMAVAPAVYGFQEYPANPPKQQPAWYAPHFLLKKGVLEIPQEPGLGVAYDEDIFKNVERTGH